MEGGSARAPGRRWLLSYSSSCVIVAGMVCNTDHRMHDTGWVEITAGRILDTGRDRRAGVRLHTYQGTKEEETASEVEVFTRHVSLLVVESLHLEPIVSEW